MVGFASRAAQCVFGVLLAGSVILAWLFCIVARLLRQCFSAERQAELNKSVSGILIAMLVLMWRLVLFFCAWIRIDIEYADGPFLGASGKPAVLLMNHTSFMDSVLAVSMAPLKRSSDVRVLVANGIFKIPLLGTVMREMGLPEVPFKVTAEGSSGGDPTDLTVDKNLMHERLRAFNDHIKSGGVGAWFPEGMVNLGDPTKLQEFRAGAFSILVDCDVEIWCCATVGCSACWPFKTLVGGLPAHIRAKAFRLTASSHALLSDVEGDQRAKAIYLAGLTRKIIQDSVTDLLASPGMLEQEKQS
eukprot:Skav229729  [mRNA]  locus=scaffold1287:41719:42624:+ [translate_table: standard]